MDSFLCPDALKPSVGPFPYPLNGDDSTCNHGSAEENNQGFSPFLFFGSFLEQLAVTLYLSGPL